MPRKKRAATTTNAVTELDREAVLALFALQPKLDAAIIAAETELTPAAAERTLRALAADRLIRPIDRTRYKIC